MTSGEAWIDVSSVRWWLASKKTAADLAPLLEAAAKIQRGSASNLKPGRRKELHRLGAGGRNYLVKINRYDGSVSRLRRLRVSKARREFRIARALLERGIETPFPVAAGEKRGAGGLEACYLVVSVQEGVTDLATLWHGAATAGTRRAWTQELGGVARRVHDAGLVQEDFAPNNFLATRDSPGRLLPIDFERARIAHLPLRDAARMRMLATLDRHFMGASAAARLRLLDAYFAGDQARARAYWRGIAAAAPDYARRDFAHIARTCAKEGRRFRRFVAGESRAWSGWARSDSLALADVERDIVEDPPGSFGPVAVEPLTVKPAIEARGVLWRVGAPGLGPRQAVRAWAVAQWLWMRGEMAPRPIAMLRRRAQTYLWFERRAEDQRLDALAGAQREAAERTGHALLRRLAALGRFEREIQPHGISVQFLEGRWRAQILDVGAYRPGGRPRRPSLPAGKNSSRI